MNIFVLDQCPITAARYHCDKHMKMIVESAQMLSTAHRVLDGLETVEKGKTGRNIKRWRLLDPVKDLELYKASHVNHPCNRWIRESVGNYEWLYALYEALCAQYTLRYERVHKSSLLLPLLKTPPQNLIDRGVTQFAQAMPEEYRHADAVVAYRNFYLGAKASFCKWTNVAIPDWFNL